LSGAEDKRVALVLHGHLVVGHFLFVFPLEVGVPDDELTLDAAG
jgi:hypothetical protein